jgi:hypothetical protein
MQGGVTDKRLVICSLVTADFCKIIVMITLITYMSTTGVFKRGCFCLVEQLFYFSKGQSQSLPFCQFLRTAVYLKKLKTKYIKSNNRFFCFFSPLNSVKHRKPQ